ncbi:SRPBCC domain-containing protein [Aureisphaera sp. CAU 1614]|uniref:SRPBCC domain-containing protein n=1 Tax=Halomarinibacterium sedimenti TaxID=2857106 RepID=A0A9X1FMN9_9FLAO|nr:SRPBCC domain-containing protein [Halomarinibacterium sedimenti]MBW2937468.1 SRPBCC domain-containing protein [Halomarinibacterium sedimenti]
MKKLTFEIVIHAPINKVYQSILDKDLFSKWVAPFHPDSYIEGSWKKGSTVQFLSKEPDGTINGMSSFVKENIPNRLVSIEHRAYIKNGEVIHDKNEEESFSGAMEEYFFESHQGTTLLKVHADTTTKYETYFKETWPKALQKLKELVEK